MGTCPERNATDNSCLPFNPGLQTPRIDEAKKKVEDLLFSGLFDSIPLALIEYGNYEGYGLNIDKADEAFMERVSMGQHTRQMILNGLNEIKPNNSGCTPTGDALQHVGIEYFDEGNRKGSILLITDGGANCGNTTVDFFTRTIYNSTRTIQTTAFNMMSFRCR